MSIIREQIMVLIKAKLETITTGNGYNTNVQLVERMTVTPISNSELPAIYIYEEQELVEASGDLVNLGLYSNTLAVTLECWIKDKSSEKATQLNSLLEDVVKAMQADVQWTNGSGTKLAIDTVYTGNRTLLEFSSVKGNGYLGLLAQFEIIYRCKFGDLASRV
tara:strand:+ start:4627 stop:5115 length:489 start_codon:yes stop_codon:yes gene_type:complete